MGAVFGFGGRCRLLLERETLLGPGQTAGWLMCNPSTADSTSDDPTLRRVRHFSTRHGCDRVLVGNVWAWCATQPADLWGALPRGDYTPAMHSANLDALAAIGAQCDVLFVAFGAEPWRQHRRAVLEALRALWSAAPDWVVPVCLGMTRDGAPLHPLARGKLAVRNDAASFDWPGAIYAA